MHRVSAPKSGLATLAALALIALSGCSDSQPVVTGPRETPDFLVAGNGTWATKAPMPTARGFAGVAAINGILYAVGGHNDAGLPLTANEAYDPASDTWTTRAPMPTARWWFGTAAVNGVLYAVGGTPGNSGFATNEAYDPASNTWTTKAPMPTTRYGLSAIAVNGILYAIGGGIPNGPISAAVEAYNPATDTWTTKASMPTARAGVGLAAINGIVYAVGGVKDNSGPVNLSTVEAYDPGTDTWTTKAPMPTARADPIASGINGVLYAVGGALAGTQTVLATNEAYDPTTDTWTANAPMPTARDGPAGAAINGILYVVGGVYFLNPQTGFNTPVNEAFTPAFFFAPVDDPDIVNVAKAGSAVPVKFSLGSDLGLNILSPGSPSSAPYTCGSGPTDAIEQTVVATTSGLQYDPTTNQYTYVWKTDKSWSGTCRKFSLGLTDGSTHVALFQFK